MKRNPGLIAFCLGLLLSALAPSSRGQESQPQGKKASEGQQAPRPVSEGLPQQKLSKKEQEKREKALRQELGSQYKRWLDEDVAYIMMPEERSAFLQLGTDEEREQFVEQFWLRRDPTPDTIENEFKEEHYRRIAYANEHFSTSIPGWLTDRGRIYIAWGPPAEVESHPAGGPYSRSTDEGGGQTWVYPFERWRYRYLEGIGQEIILEFVDTSNSGSYELTINPADKDALANIPGSGLSFLEEMGLANKAARFKRLDRAPTSFAQLAGEQYDHSVETQFERLRVYSAVLKPPAAQFPDLEALVTTRISFNLLPFDVRMDFLRVTDDTTLVPITIAIKKKDIVFKLQDGLHVSTVNVFGRVTTMTGRVAQTFEDVLRLDVPPALLERTLQQPTIYQKALPLRPGLYKLNIVLKDLNSGNLGTLEQRLAVPAFEEEQLAHSSLILADLMERVPAKDVGTGQFVLGNTKVRPVVNDEFTPEERMGIYLQVYNLGINEQSHKPDATIEYTIHKGDRTVFAYTETTGQLERAGRQITLEKVLSLATFAPGEYTLDIKVTDQVRQQSISPSVTFHIRSN